VQLIELVVVSIGLKEESELFGEFVLVQVRDLVPHFSELTDYTKTTLHAPTESQARSMILRKATRPNQCAVIIPYLRIQMMPQFDMGIGPMSAAIAFITTVPGRRTASIAIAEGSGQEGIKAIRDLVRVRSARGDGGDEKTSGCFIATACCGASSNEVQVLRVFREVVLRPCLTGRLVIRGYEYISPAIARTILRNRFVANLLRRTLVQPFAHIATHVLNKRS
jgi:hypothetical protein